MRIDIFNVGHGQCAVVTAPNGRRMMLDCGDRWGDDRFWTPSLHFFRQTIDLLALMNLDEDHLRDFKNVMHDCTVPWVLSNPTVGPREFAALKKDGMGGAVFVTNERRYVATTRKDGFMRISTSQRTGAGPSSELQFATGRGRLLLPSSSSGLARSQP
jgi:beta-lactamase superfamily II metal-dependent hydrolase